MTSKKRSGATSKRYGPNSGWEIQFELEKQQRIEQFEHAVFQVEQVMLDAASKVGKLVGVCRSLIGVRPAAEPASCVSVNDSPATNASVIWKTIPPQGFLGAKYTGVFKPPAVSSAAAAPPAAREPVAGGRRRRRTTNKR